MARESLGPAVVAGEVIYSSVSAVQKFLACPRAWWLRYVARVPDKPPSRNARLGTAGHARWQRYLETGDDRELAGSERVVLAKGWAPPLPLPRSTCLAEVAIHTTEGGLISPLQIDGVPLVGYVDVVDATVGVVQDWKYKGDIDQYVSSAEDLVDPGTDAGVQMIGYAVAISRWTEAVAEWGYWPGASIELRHVTMGLTGSPDARITRARLAPAQAGVAWLKVVDRVAARGGLREVARLPRWQDVPCDRSHCDRYGGCAYRARCHDLVAQLLSYTKGGPPMGIFDRMSPPVAPSTPAAPPAPAPEARLVGGPLGAPDRDRRLLHIDVTPPDAPQLPTAATAVVGGRYLRAGRVVVCTGEAGGWQLFAVEGATGPDGKPIIDRVPLTDPCPPAAPPLTAPPPAPTAPVASPPPADPPAPAPTGAQAPAAPTLTSPSRPPSGVCLYFGCSPVGIATSTLHSYVAALDAQVRQGLQDTALDVRLSQAEPLKYKGWQAVLMIATQNSPPPPGHYVVPGYGDDRIDAVAQALIPLADLVVR